MDVERQWPGGQEVRCREDVMTEDLKTQDSSARSQGSGSQSWVMVTGPFWALFPVNFPLDCGVRKLWPNMVPVADFSFMHDKRRTTSTLTQIDFP